MNTLDITLDGFNGSEILPKPLLTYCPDFALDCRLLRILAVTAFTSLESLKDTDEYRQIYSFSLTHPDMRFMPTKALEVVWVAEMRLENYPWRGLRNFNLDL